MSVNNSITDFDRAKFLEKLVQSSRATDGVMLTEWELEFIGSYQQYAQYHRFFTEGRRAATDRMWMKHGSMLDLPHPTDLAGPVKRPEDQAAPDGCEFWIREDGLRGSRPHRCNEPALFMGRRGLRYCQAHADEVRENMRRIGRSIELRPFAAASPVPGDDAAGMTRGGIS